jgi:FtsP/CotA-like multicopper oxidase with cupredoxin domain
MTQAQVMGGASGAIIVEGIEKLKPQVIGLKERVIILRDSLLNIIGDPDASNLTVNFVPATFPETGPPIIEMQPSEKQFWRVLNASGETFMTLQMQVDGVAEDLDVLSLDGTPFKEDRHTKTILLPPAGRAEFIVQAPASGSLGSFITQGTDTGPDGDPNPPALLGRIQLTSSSSSDKDTMHAGKEKVDGSRFADLGAQPATIHRKLYFSEDLTDPDNPKFFITVDGQTPKLFDPNDPPAIVTHQGAVEAWTIENRSGEIHAFHMHQIHFLLMKRNGKDVSNMNIQDTVDLPAWDGKAKNYPNMTLHMDFRYPESVGTFVYHCHILDHEDGGMMAKIQVLPAK